MSSRGISVLYPYFWRTGPGSVYGVEISPELVRRSGPNIPRRASSRAIFEQPFPFPAFDAVMIFNAFPFPRRRTVFRLAHSYLAREPLLISIP